ncbi:MAG TPA: histidine phosphatase family protein [Beijerinckiaceae bacterium]|jgi:alpha-ribazole phosphatase|nr:histidine phosphatase family protein [Beijerinckiaceae bacterium]
MVDRPEITRIQDGSFARTRFFWVRHAPVRNDGGRIYGQRDLSCDCSDGHVFVALARVLPRDAVWVASNLRRTHETARAIWAADRNKFAGLKFQEIAALAEQDLGEWQGLNRAEFFSNRKPTPGSFWFAPADERAPGGESFADLVARVRTAIANLSEAHRDRGIIAVAHGGTIRAAIAIALDLTPQAGLAFATDNCAITRLDFYAGEGGQGWRVVSINHQPWEGLAEVQPAGPEIARPEHQKLV